jgi:hypothetical protein
MDVGLFGEMQDGPMPTRKERQRDERRRKMKLAYAATAERWKAAVWEFRDRDLCSVDKTELFIFEDLTAAYEAYAKLYRKPLTIEKRAFAGIQQRLLREGKMEVVEGLHGRSYEGNIRPMYRSLI